jgi:sarcosine oxidase
MWFRISSFSHSDLFRISIFGFRVSFLPELRQILFRSKICGEVRMLASYDVIVVGLGAMGSAAVYHLAKHGKKVLGLDRFSPPHTFGSSHGETRIIREAYFEHPTYVPIIQRAYDLWADLEREANRSLFLQTGGLMIGRADGIVFSGAKRSAEIHRLSHEVLSASDVRSQFPGIEPAEDMMAVREPRAGILFPQVCIESHLALARLRGACLQFDEPVVRWRAEADGVRVLTSKGEYTAGRLLLTAGAWIRSLLPDLKIPLTIERQILFWFQPRENAGLFKPGRCPIYLWEYEPEKFFYGFPDLGTGVKVARHHEGQVTDADNVRREVGSGEIESMRGIVRRFLPQADGPLKASTVCLYTNTPDGHFFIDVHPAHAQVLVASPCSGHGFKFSSVIGEILSDLMTQGQSRFDLSLFRNRFG